MMIPPIAVTSSPLDAIALRREVHDTRAGSVVVFEGCARDHHDGKDVELLAYEAFESMAVSELQKLRDEAMERFGLYQCIIHHRTGIVPLCEAAVVVVVSSAHRQASFESVGWIMDRIKEHIPIWKRERYTAGSESWVEGEERR
nr:molybdenum cofactor biosynthesis protein MoaE [uncultured Holophaga sp.]